MRRKSPVVKREKQLDRTGDLVDLRVFLNDVQENVGIRALLVVGRLLVELVMPALRLIVRNLEPFSRLVDEFGTQ